MLERVSAYLFSLLFCIQAEAQLPPIGQWRQHFPWEEAIQVVGGDRAIWCATPWGVFSVDPTDGSLNLYTKIEGLRGTQINAIAWDSTSATLVIAYQNGQIDLLQNHQIKGIASLRESGKPWNKSIRHVFTKGGKAYLSTDFGILLVDLTLGEIKDTYLIGHEGQEVPVTQVDTDGQRLYAITSEGLKTLLVQDPHPADFRNWEHTHIQAADCANFQGHMVISRNDSVWIQRSGQWSFFFADGHSIKKLVASKESLYIIEQDRIVIVSENGTILKVVKDRSTPEPQYILQDGSTLWIADRQKGLIKYEANQFLSYNPYGPASLLHTTLLSKAGKIYGTSGDGYINFLDGSRWTRLDSTQYAGLKGYRQIDPIALDPQNGTLWGSARGQALFSFTENKITQWDQPGNKNVGAMHVDAQGQLWLTYDSTVRQLWVRKKNGTWMSFSIPFQYQGIHISTIISDVAGQIWMILPQGQGIVCFSYGLSIDNRGDDQWKRYLTGAGNGNLPTDEVKALMTDKDGFLWLGTAKGIGILQCVQEAFTSIGCEVYLPIVQQGSFAAYLFRDKSITTLATDGANRKWIGTAQEGVWLISETGEQTVYQFNSENSPLPSNQIQKIVIEPATGEVFIATAAGMVSFRSDATEDNLTLPDPVRVFPNPVASNYTGRIAIKGLRSNSVVKITGLDGRLVFETRTLGGQAIWDGRHYKGGKVSPGIYLVLVQDEMKTYHTVTKIVVAGKL